MKIRLSSMLLLFHASRHFNVVKVYLKCFFDLSRFEGLGSFLSLPSACMSYFWHMNQMFWLINTIICKLACVAHLQQENMVNDGIFTSLNYNGLGQSNLTSFVRVLALDSWEEFLFLLSGLDQSPEVRPILNCVIQKTVF